MQADLIKGDSDGAWKDLALKDAFTDAEWRAFFARASKLFNEEDVLKGAQRISLRVHGEDGFVDNNGDPAPPDWEADLDGHCPGDATLNIMYGAAAAFVDNNKWE